MPASYRDRQRKIRFFQGKCKTNPCIRESLFENIPRLCVCVCVSIITMGALYLLNSTQGDVGSSSGVR